MTDGRKKICVVGGGAAGVSLLWCLTSNETTRSQVELTLLHNEPQVGGHSHTLYPNIGGQEYPVDIGVQYICPLLYPNTYKTLERPEFTGVGVTDGQIRLGAAFSQAKNWGNFPVYQSGSRFGALYTTANAAAADKFAADVLASTYNGNFERTMGEYLPGSGLPQDFVDYFLMPYLSILNGYGDDQQLLLAEFQDLFPLFVDLSTKHAQGPLAAFTQPGRGWQRFTHGASSWVMAMATHATAYGATIMLNQTVTGVWPDPDGGVWVQWGDPRSPAPTAAKFDEVVLTTDMDTNYALLKNEKNPHFGVQEPHIAPGVFQLNPGSCYIHQDPTMLAPWLQDQAEIVQFTATDPPPAGSTLPYNMGTAYSTYMVQNMVDGVPAPVYVSMFGENEPQRAPAESKWLHDPIQWKHGRFLGSMLMDVKRELHTIQGLGNVWFAGNNTTMDSEEGALLSAMVIAEKVSPDWTYPFASLDPLHDYPLFWFELMKHEFMFPTTKGGRAERYARWAKAVLEGHHIEP